MVAGLPARIPTVFNLPGQGLSCLLFMAEDNTSNPVRKSQGDKRFLLQKSQLKAMAVANTEHWSRLFSGLAVAAVLTGSCKLQLRIAPLSL